MSLSRGGGVALWVGEGRQPKPPWQTGSSLRQMATLLSLPAPSCPAQLISSENAGVTLPLPQLWSLLWPLQPSSPVAPRTHSLGSIHYDRLVTCHLWLRISLLATELAGGCR